MARHKSFSLGALTGTIGPVVLSSWNGIEYVRTKPTKPAGKPSFRQLEHRLKVKTLSQFLSRLNCLLKISYRDNRPRTGMNNAMQYNFKNVFTGIYPNIGIDYRRVRVAGGLLPGTETFPAHTTGTTIHFNWTPNGGTGSARDDDQVILLAYSEKQRQCLPLIGAADRSAGAATLNASSFGKERVHTWLAFMSADGVLKSESVYTGSLMLEGE